jgi:predicted TIM-barrel fold metal-dependent hydrolase
LYLAAALLPFGLPAQGEGNSGEAQRQVISIVDTHAHIIRSRRGNASQAATHALEVMDAQGVELTILSPPPFPEGHRGLYGRRELIPLVKEHPTRFAFAAGGESLNGFVHSTPAQRVTAADVQRLQEEAEEIAKSGAIGFGEIAIEHLSSGRGSHPYESVPADHPLLLALCDVASRLNMPIDIHMEALPQDSPPPPFLASFNPERLPANIAAFERLLEHNPRAVIVWAHAGWDLTGERTVPLMRSLLAKHANLFMSIKLDSAGPQRTSPFAPDGGLRPAWLNLLNEFRNRFVIGSDQFYDEGDARVSAARRFVNALPTEVATAVARDNARRIYPLLVEQGSAVQKR